MADYSSFSDEQLVSLCRSNDPVAWSELCSRYISVARALAVRFTVAGVETDDLAQEGLMGFLSAVHSYKDGCDASFSTYAGVCIRNRIINAVKAIQTKKQVPYEMCLSIEDEKDIADTSMTPEESLVSRDEAERISQAISARLTEREQLVFRLYLIGYKYNEIASRLSISLKAVEGALSRSRKKLKSELGVKK